MHFSLSSLVLATTVLDITLAQPFHRVHKHLHRLDLAAVLKDKRQDWNDPNLYKGVDWTKIDYGNAGAAAPAPNPTVASSPTPPAPSPTAASSPTPAAPKQLSVEPVTNSNSGSGKRGLAYNDTSPDLNMFDGYSKITWGYDWASTITPVGGLPLPSSFQYVPMLFDNAQATTKAWAGAVSAATSGSGTHYLLAFNEPDMPIGVGGTAIDVGSAVDTYTQYMNPHASANVKLGAPAVSNSGASNQGLIGWLQPFLQQCSGCIIDFVPVHWYGSSADDFKTHVQQAMALAGGKPIWVTEFQCQSGDQSAFLAEVLPWMDGQAGIERYSYFMASSQSLTNGNALSAVGQKYASA